MKESDLERWVMIVLLSSKKKHGIMGTNAKMDVVGVAMEMVDAIK